MSDMEHADDLFDGSFDTLESFIERKRAAADVDRYRALFYVHEHPDENVRMSDLPTDEIRPLLDANLLARVPHPDGDDTVRITTLGKNEIEGDLRYLRTGESQEGEL